MVKVQGQQQRIWADIDSAKGAEKGVEVKNYKTKLGAALATLFGAAVKVQDHGKEVYVSKKSLQEFASRNGGLKDSKMAESLRMALQTVKGGAGEFTASKENMKILLDTLAAGGIKVDSAITETVKKAGPTVKLSRDQVDSIKQSVQNHLGGKMKFDAEVTADLKLVMAEFGGKIAQKGQVGTGFTERLSNLFKEDVDLGSKVDAKSAKLILGKLVGGTGPMDESIQDNKFITLTNYRKEAKENNRPEEVKFLDKVIIAAGYHIDGDDVKSTK